MFEMKFIEVPVGEMNCLRVFTTSAYCTREHNYIRDAYGTCSSAGPHLLLTIDRPWHPAWCCKDAEDRVPLGFPFKILYLLRMLII